MQMHFTPPPQYMLPPSESCQPGLPLPSKQSVKRHMPLFPETNRVLPERAIPAHVQSSIEELVSQQLQRNEMDGIVLNRTSSPPQVPSDVSLVGGDSCSVCLPPRFK